jgi:acetylornithine deacetylase/succinyl-diaminopimelate desuccinylase-like protein
MSTLADRLEAAIDPMRLVERTLDLVAIPSFPGAEGPVASRYAGMLRDAGLEVTIEERYPGSPSVIARADGGRQGPTLQLAGHLDTVPVDQGPPLIRDGVLHGRGACDMKAGLAAIAEVATALRREPAWDGGMLITAYGQHEGSPSGTMHEPLRDLLRRGIHGDLVFIPEGPHTTLPVAGKGSIILEVHLERDGEPAHELFAEPGTPNPVLAAYRYVELVREHSAGWGICDDAVGDETFFLGAIRGGDLYNRVATTARIDATRRYPAPRTFADASAELEAIGRQVADEHGVRVRVVCHRSGQPFRIDPGHPYIRAFQSAASSVMGAPLPENGILLASDINHVMELAGVPTVLHGADGTRAHATPEWVPVEEINRLARVLARTVGETLERGDGGTVTS